MVKGDEFYGESVEGCTKKAVFKIANLMAHKYELSKPEKAILLKRNNDQVVVLASGDVFIKAVY